MSRRRKKAEALTPAGLWMSSSGQFANALFSDGGAPNPKFGQRAREGAVRPPTGLFTPESERDYFREDAAARAQMPSAPAESITPQRITQSVRMRANTIRGLTFERLTSYLDQWRLGFFRSAGMLWETMLRRDYQLQIAAPKRMKSVARHGYDIMTVEEIPDGLEEMADEQARFLKYFYDHVSTTTALNPDEEGGLSLLLRQMMGAVGTYYSVHEIVWQPQADGNLAARFIHCPVWWFEGTRGKLRFLDSEFQVYGREMEPGEWVVTCGDGLMEACSVLYLFKALPMKSWVTYLDKFAQPGLHLKTDAQKGSKEWNDAVEALTQFAEDFATVTNRSAELSLIEAKASGDASYDRLIEKIDRAITQLWRGGDLGTSSDKTATGASLQGDESEILETDDAKLLEETLAAKVSRYALSWRFGPDAPQLVYLKLRTTPHKNIQEDLAVDQWLATQDFPMTLGGLAERYNRDLPDDVDPKELVEPQSEKDAVLAREKAFYDYRSQGKSDPEVSNDDGEWRTINGTHVLIKEGESVREAVKEKFGDDDKDTDRKKRTSAREKSNLKGRKDERPSPKSEGSGTAARAARDGRGDESGSGASTRSVIERSTRDSRAARHELPEENARAQAELARLHDHGGTAIPLAPHRKLSEGEEHLVEMNEAGDRVIKHTKPGHYGVAFGGMEAPMGSWADLRAATPGEYLERLQESNRIFGDDARVEGTSRIGGHVGIVTSQRYIHGEHPKQQEIDALLSSKGFKKVHPDRLGSDYIGDKTWYHPKTGHIVADTKPDNFRKDQSGAIYPIDVIVQRTEPGTSLRRAMESGISFANEREHLPGTLFRSLEPLRAQLSSISEMQSAELQRQALAQLVNDAPAIKEFLRHSPRFKNSLEAEVEARFIQGTKP